MGHHATIRIFSINNLPLVSQHPYPEVGVLEVGAVVLDDVGRIALLHDRDFLDDLLQVGVHWNLKSNERFSLVALKEAKEKEQKGIVSFIINR